MTRKGAGTTVRGWLAPAGLILGLLVIWESVVRWRDVPRWLLPPPSVVAITLFEERSLLWQHSLATLSAVLVGFVLAISAGVLLAIAVDLSPLLDRAVYPLIVASQTIPVPALAPLLLIWFGYGLLPKVLVTALIAFFPIVVNTVEGLRSPDPEVIAMMRTFGANRWTRFRMIKLPAAMPYLFTGARIGAAVAVIGAVFGELVGAQAGLGYLLTRAMAQFQTERVVAAIFLLSLMGLGLFGLVGLLERLLLPWRRFTASE